MANVDFTDEDCEKLDKLYTDVYIGKDLDNLSIVARLHNIEQKLKGQDKFFWAVVLMGLTIIGDIVSRHLGGK